MLTVACVFTGLTSTCWYLISCLLQWNMAGRLQFIHCFIDRLHFSCACCHIWKTRFKCMQWDRAAAFTWRSYIAAPQLAFRICHARQFVCGLWKPLLGNQESAQFLSHSQWINYQNNSFPAAHVFLYIFPLYVSRPLYSLALCTFIASIGSGWLQGPKWTSLRWNISQ